MLSIRATLGSTEYPLPVLTPALAAEIQAWYDAGRFTDLVNPDEGLIGPDDPEPRVGALQWPVVGASRFARGLFAIDTTTLAALRTEVGTLLAEDDGGPILDEDEEPVGANAAAAVTLVFRDDPTDTNEAGREVPLYLIASRPVSRTDDPDADDLWLISLVDDRYFWVHTTGGEDEWWDIYPPDKTWDDVFDTLFGQLGAAHTLDAVSGDYLSPTERWGSDGAKNSSVAFLLDYAAACVGSRIVITPGATPAVQRPTAGNRAAATDWHDALVTADRFAGGGELDGDELLGGLPGNVRMSFPNGAVINSALPSGAPGKYVEAWHDCSPCRNSGQRAAYLAQYADDWYAWQNSPLDAIYAGFVLPPLSGFLGGVEWFHDATTGYTRVTRPASGWTHPPEWRPGTFPATITTVYDPAAPSGAPFARAYDWQHGSTGAAGHYLFEVNGRDDLQPGLAVLTTGEYFGCQRWFEYNPPCAGCNLEYVEETNCYKVDVPSLAGNGLTARQVGDCYTLDVDAGYLPGDVTLFGCGLDFNGVDTLSVDLSAVVTDPFVWTGCQLDLNIGCNLTLDGVTGALKVDRDVLVGAANVTSMVVGPDDCDVAVDLTTVTDEPYTVVTDVLLHRVAGGMLRLTSRKMDITNRYNAAGLLIDQLLGTVYAEQFLVDICDTDCCEDCVPTVTIDSPSSGTIVDVNETVSFTSTVSGSCGSTYSYHWEFGDGQTSDEEDPQHTYTSQGTKVVTLTVTDECGRVSDEVTTYVLVGGGSDPGTTCATAGTLLLGQTVTYDYAENVSYSTWWVVDVEPNTDYSVTISGLQGGGNLHVHGGICVALTSLVDDVANACYEFTTAADDTRIWVWVEGQEFANGTYTLVVNLGDCP